MLNFKFRSTLVTFGVLTFAMTAPAFSQPNLSFVDPLQDPLGLSAPPEIEFDVSLVSSDPKPGGEVLLLINVKLPKTAYIYSQNSTFGGATVFTVSGTGFEPLGDFVPSRPPKVVYSKEFKQNVEKFIGGVIWLRRYKIADDADIASIQLSGTINGQFCTDTETGACYPIRGEEFTVGFAKPKADEPETNAASDAERHVVEIRPKNRQKKDEPVLFQVSLPKGAKVGEEVDLRIQAAMEGVWHIYSTTAEDVGGYPTRLNADELTGLEAVDAKFSASRAPVRKFEEDEWLEYFEKDVTWTRTFKVTAANYGVNGSISYLLCTDKTCLQPLTVKFAVAPASVPVVAETPAEPSSVVPPDDPTQGGLLPFVIAAVLAGFAALLTPCVFPMIPITVSFFLKQSEEGTHRPTTMATVYCLGIIGTFTVLGMLMAIVFGATSLNRFVNNEWLNLGLGAMLVFFGFNLLGMFEIRTPSWLLSWSSSRESSGYVGILFMALTFTLVSFTCTFAFAGLLLVWAAKGQFYWPIVGLLAFSAAFSLPFFFLALFPSYLKRLPQSGGWMNTVKVTMGMIELAAAFKFFSTADWAANSSPVVFDYGLVMTAWMVIAICTGMYLLGTFRLPHDSATESISVPRLAFALMFLGLGGFMAVGMFGSKAPTGEIWAQIAAFAPADLEIGEDDEIGPVSKHDGLEYALDYERAQKSAAKRNVPLFLDFTGVNCVNCRKMENAVLNDPKIHELLANFARIQLYTDSVPGVTDKVLEAKLLKTNWEKQEAWFGDVTLPSYAVVTPDGKHVLSSSKGLSSIKDFNAFLNKGLEEWDKQSGKPVASRSKVEATTRTADTATAVPVGLTRTHGGLAFALNFDEGKRSAGSSNQPIFLMFSAINHVGCAQFERSYLADQTNHESLNRFIRVQMFMDSVPSDLDEAMESVLLKATWKLQEEMAGGDISVPMCFVLRPDGSILTKLVGPVSPEQFKQFLDTGFKKWELQRAVAGQ